MNILKENGKEETFEISKIEESIRNVGVNEKTAKEIAFLVSDRKPSSTKDARKIISKELRNRSVEASRNYEEVRSAARSYIESRRLVAKHGNKTAKGVTLLPGVALLPKNAMTRLNLDDGDRFMVMHGNQRHTLIAKLTEEDNIRWNEIWLHDDDMQNIGASDGVDIIAQRNIV